VNGISSIWLVLLCQYLSHSHEKVSSVLLEERLYADVEFFMSFDSIGIVEHGGDQVTMLDIHVFKSVPLLLTVQLIKQGLFQIDPLNIQNHSQTLVVPLVAQHMKHISPSIIYIDFLMYHI